MARPTKNIAKALEQDWHAPEGQDPLSKIKRILSVTDARKETTKDPIVIPEDTPIPQMSKLFGYNRKTQTWEHLGYRCFSCGKPLRDGRVTEKHPLICKRTLKINKEEQEILARVGNRDFIEEPEDDLFED